MLNQTRKIGILLLLGAMMSTASFAEVRTRGDSPPFEMVLAQYDAAPINLITLQEVTILKVQVAEVDLLSTLIFVKSDLNFERAGLVDERPIQNLKRSNMKSWQFGRTGIYKDKITRNYVNLFSNTGNPPFKC